MIGQEFWRGARARRVMTGERLPQALLRLAGRNRRRYGGYLVHAGIAVLFLGVAASSAFIDQHDVRLSPGESFEIDGYQVTYVRPTAKLGGDDAGTGAPISLRRGARRAQGRQALHAAPVAQLLLVQRPVAGADLALLRGRGDQRGRHALGAASSDFWLAVRPDLGSLTKPLREADRKFGDSNGDVQALVIAALAERYRKDPPPAAFRAIVSPLVAWIWIGGGIAVLGALIAVWPTPEARLRRVRSLYSARVGHELSRAA